MNRLRTNSRFGSGLGIGPIGPITVEQGTQYPQFPVVPQQAGISPGWIIGGGLAVVALLLYSRRRKSGPKREG